MRLRVVRIKDEIPKLKPNERMVHLAFRPTMVDIVNLVGRCPRLEAVQIPLSRHRKLPSDTRRILEARDIDLLAGDARSHKSDTGEYIVVDEGVIEEIREMVSEGVGAEEVVARVQRTARLAPDLIWYIIKTSI